jgi:hypothetical protein
MNWQRHFLRFDLDGIENSRGWKRNAALEEMAEQHGRVIAVARRL